MSESNWDGILATAAEEVLETMFFTSIYGPGACAQDAEPRLAAQLVFEGTPCGALTLSVAEPSAQSLASNFLAAECDERLPAAQLGAVVCELANMICGALLSRVESETHFRLSKPELLEAGAAYPEGPANQSLDLGDGTLDLWLRLENHAG